jgi:chromosome segregation ATPase
LPWFVAGALAFVAYEASAQLTLQRQILGGAQQLASTVAESKQVTAAMNLQLADLKRLAGATEKLSVQVGGVRQTNGQIRASLEELSGTIGTIQAATTSLAGSTGEAATLLKEIEAESAALDGVMAETSSLSSQVTVDLQSLVKLQQFVTVDLDTIVQKTKLLERLSGGS